MNKNRPFKSYSDTVRVTPFKAPSSAPNLHDADDAKKEPAPVVAHGADHLRAAMASGAKSAHVAQVNAKATFDAAIANASNRHDLDEAKANYVAKLGEIAETFRVYVASNSKP